MALRDVVCGKLQPTICWAYIGLQAIHAARQQCSQRKGRSTLVSVRDNTRVRSGLAVGRHLGEKHVRPVTKPLQENCTNKTWEGIIGTMDPSTPYNRAMHMRNQKNCRIQRMLFRTHKLASPLQLRPPSIESTRNTYTTNSKMLRQIRVHV